MQKDSPQFLCNPHDGQVDFAQLEVLWDDACSRLLLLMAGALGRPGLGLGGSFSLGLMLVPCLHLRG